MSQVSELVPPSELHRIFDYDLHTGNLIWRHRDDVAKQINSRCVGKIAGTKKPGEIQVCVLHNGTQRLLRAHRVVWALVTGEWPRGDLDHRNGNPHDNRFENLRLATSSDNRCNIRRVRSATGLRGVHRSSSGSYYASAKKHGEMVRIGPFKLPQDAAAAYDELASRLQGEFAVTNKSLGLLEDRNVPVN